MHLQPAEVPERRQAVEGLGQVASVVMTHAGIHEFLLEPAGVLESDQAVAILIDRAHSAIDSTRIGAIRDEGLEDHVLHENAHRAGVAAAEVQSDRPDDATVDVGIAVGCDLIGRTRAGLPASGG